MVELVNGNVIFCQANSLCFIMSKQPIEHLLVKIEFMSTLLLHYKTPNNNMC